MWEAIPDSLASPDGNLCQAVNKPISNSFQTNLCAVLSLTTLWSDGFIVHSSWQQAKSEVTALLPLWQKLAPPWQQFRPGHSATDTYTIHTTYMLSCFHRITQSQCGFRTVKNEEADLAGDEHVSAPDGCGTQMGDTVGVPLADASSS